MKNFGHTTSAAYNGLYYGRVVGWLDHRIKPNSREDIDNTGVIGNGVLDKLDHWTKAENDILCDPTAVSPTTVVTANRLMDG